MSMGNKNVVYDIFSYFDREYDEGITFASEELANEFLEKHHKDGHYIVKPRVVRKVYTSLDEYEKDHADYKQIEINKKKIEYAGLKKSIKMPFPIVYLDNKEKNEISFEELKNIVNGNVVIQVSYQQYLELCVLLDDIKEQIQKLEQEIITLESKVDKEEEDENEAE